MKKIILIFMLTLLFAGCESRNKDVKYLDSLRVGDTLRLNQINYFGIRYCWEDEYNIKYQIGGSCFCTLDRRSRVIKSIWIAQQ